MSAEVAQRIRFRAKPGWLSARIRRTPNIPIALICGVFVTFCVCTATLRAETPTMRVRVAWGGGEATAWIGAIEVRGGRIVEKQSLGIEADEPGSMWIKSGQLVVRQRSARQYDGVDVALVASLQSKLIVTLQPVGHPEQATREEIDLASLVADQQSAELVGENRLLVRRAPGDRLRVRILTQSLVFAPGDVMRLELQPHLLGLAAGSNVKLQSRVVRARSSDELSSSPSKFTTPRDGEMAAVIPMDVSVPENEGVYDFVITATVPAERIQFTPGNPFRQRERVVAERRVQFLVMEAKSPQAGDADQISAPDKHVAEINPSKPWWKRVTRLPTLPGFGSGPLQQGDVQSWQHPELGKLTRLGPSPADDDPTWAAYPLSIDEPGQVHMLEVQYPGNLPQSMAISILEPNAAGAVLPIGLDSGVLVPPNAADDPPTMQVHRIPFWPRSKEPVLLITNGRNDGPAAHGRIRVLGPRGTGVAALSWAGGARSRLPRIPATGLPRYGRMFAGYMERPLIPENFSATEAFDTWSQRSMDDWVTFYQAGTRLIEYLQYAGNNALVLSVMAGGSTIYPSQHVEPTPRYDTGVFFSNGQDPVRKDVLEMLLRMCDREGIRLIPALQFSTPLPELENQLRDGGPRSVGIELTDARGITWMQNHAGDKQYSAFYNPLNPSVQQAMLNVVREIVGRYRHHSSLAGLAVGTSGHGYSLLPGPDWGYDSNTIGQFTRDVPLPDGAPIELAKADPVARARTAQRTEWLDWRATRLRQFHQQMAVTVRTALPDAKLYIATSTMHGSPEIDYMTQPSLPARFGADDWLLGIGVQPALYDNPNDGIVLIRSRSATPDFSVSDQATALQLDRSIDLDRRFSESGKTGALLRLEPHKTRVASFDARSPFGKASTHTMIVPHAIPAGSANRKLFVGSLSATDTDQIMMGGWMLPLGQEDTLRDFISAFLRLPTGQYETVPGNHQPIVIRTLAVGPATYAYLVNDSPWKCQVTMLTTAGDQATVQELAGERALAGPSRGRWQVSLDRYDFRAVRIDQPRVRISDATITFDKDVRGILKEQIHDLSDRTIALNRRTNVDVLENADFEVPADGRRIPGWELAGKGGIASDLDAGERHAGTASARLSSQGNVASLISDGFAAPRTGRIAFTVWLKMSADFRGPLRLAVSGTRRGRDIYRFGVVPKTQEWQLFEFQTDDLPLKDLSDLQVRFDLMGPGRVWIDDISVSDLRFSDNELKELSRILTHAHFALNGDKLGECDRILHGYWPRFLRQHVVLADRPIAGGARPVRQAELPRREPVKEPDQSPWWKMTLPGFLR